MSDRDEVERQVHELGNRIFDLAGESSPTIFDARWWSGKMLEWCIRNETFKVDMFRFVDVFPMLHGAEDVARHITEYFGDVDDELPAPLRWGIKAAGAGTLASRVAAVAARENIEALARRFIAGESPRDAVHMLGELWESGVAFSVDLLGEATLSAPEAEAYRRRYLELLDVLSEAAETWQRRPQLESAPWGKLPRVNVSVKPSALQWQLDAADFDGSVERLTAALLPIFRSARTRGAFLNLDVEQYALKDVTYAAFRRVLEEPELSDFEHAGIVCQAYLRDAYADLGQLAAWARERERSVTVRLVKGAYWDFEVVRARQLGHRCPVFADKAATDASFERCAELLIEHHDVLRPAFGTHNVRSLAAAMTYAQRAGLDPAALEVQMLYGMAEPLKHAVGKLGYRLREYVPLGALVPGMAYLVRRLLENTSNESFLRASFVERVDRAMLLAGPQPADERGDDDGATRVIGDPSAFHNEPTRDLTDSAQRGALARAVAAMSEALASDGPQRVPTFIGDREAHTDDVDPSRNPARPDNIVALTSRADLQDVDEAVAAARAAHPDWRDTPVEARAALLFRAAERLRARRDAIVVLEMFEVGKPWREADADACEAIDFLEYYGRRALELARDKRVSDMPGERNELVYEGRGVAVVIAPWNFPLAIVTGMSAAALVMGNSVIVKPAEQSPATAWCMIQALRDAGAPPGTLGFLPGPGESVGARLVEHAQVDLIAFTGSADVGLSIVEKAARTRPEQRNVKRVIAEMGGKNAIIVDDDADLDEAVQGVLRSAFEYAGQKCSACSRAIVLASVHDAFLSRLIEAARSLVLGAPWHPATQMGPVVDETQYRNIERWRTVAREEGEVVLERAVEGDGWFIAPIIVAGIRPEHRIAREEIFGPLLSVMRAADFDEALEWANSSRFALTGGLYSRSPAHIARARRELRVGNLYLNRSITGALVGRQPFGGLKLSGVGAKAGGPDYLLQFVDSRSITENTVRRGFAPDVRA